MKYQQFTKLSRLLLALVMTVTTCQLFAQSNDGIFFQAVARDNFSNAAKDRKIFVQTSIIQSTTTGNKLLIEEHQATTDASGVFSISIGNGNRVGGASSSLSSIDWSKGPFFLNLKVAITPIGGNSSWDYTKEWVDMGTTNFGAVPFAYYAAQVAGFDTKLNVSDSAKMLLPYAKTATLNTLSSNVDTKLNTKLNIADSANGYVTPAQLAAKTFDQTPITNAIATKLNIADSITKYITPSQLASYNFSSGGGGNTVTVDTTSLSNRINLKANITDLTSINSALTIEATTARAAELALANNVTSNTTAISAEVTRAIAAELLLTNNVASNTASITANTTAINLKANTSDVSNALNLKANASDISTLTTNLASNTTAISAETTRATAAELVLTNNVTANTASINSNSNALNLKAPLASPTFTGTLTAPIYATTPQSLTSGPIITWNPTLGLNASVTLDQNSTLSFSSTPPSGSYGTLVITQDATGSRTITLPSTTNKVLGSTSSTTIALSSAANAKDILNFYFDGTNCYWNIGQGYGIDASSGSTNLASGVTGTLAVANGGTGATTAAAARTNLGLVIGTNVQAPLVAGTDYQAPITLTTTGTGAATLSGNTLNIPAVSSTVNSNTLSGTVALVNGGTGATSKSTAFDALSPMTTAGDLIYGGTNGTGVRLGKGNNGTVLTMENNIPTWLTSIRATAGSSYNAAVGFSFLGGDWARNTGMFSDNPDGGGAATLKFRIATSNSTADPYLEISPSKVSVFPTTASTSKTTGALTVAGGLGVTENIYASNLNTSGSITSGAVTYPIAHGTSGQVLTTTGSGTLTFTTPTVAKPISDQFTATAAQTIFTLTQTPITNTTVSPNIKPNVWMYINGIRTNNLAYSVSGTTVTYTASSNNNYAIVVGDRIQFDYAY